jgi:hypothetical protein
MSAGRVQVCYSKTNGQVEVGIVLAECLRPNGHVEVASSVALKRPGTHGHIILAGCIVGKRI